MTPHFQFFMICHFSEKINEGVLEFHVKIKWF